MHGAISLLLMFLAVTIGAYSIALSSRLLATAYLVISLLSSIAIVYSFCSKCPCRATSCGHILPGKLTALLPQRKEGQYGALDYAGVVIPFLIIVIFPQPWMLGNLLLLGAFWGLLVIALLEINFVVCKGCNNIYCPVNKGGNSTL